MTDFRYLLAIYVHAHETGNSVPPHIDSEARAALAEPVSDGPAVPDDREPASVTAHPTGIPELSPAAQAVWEAFNEDEAGVFVDYGEKLAAALRAATDQVVPVPHLPYDSCCDVHASAIRAELLAIAIELETQ